MYSPERRMGMQNNFLITAQEVAQQLGVSKATAYKMIHGWNETLKNRGFTTVSGKISRQYFVEQFYGMAEQKEVM